MENSNLLPIGALLQDGKYRVEEQLASGGFGNTYKVVDTQTHQVLAMKEFYLKGVNERESTTQRVSVSNAENSPEFLTQKTKFHKEAMRLQQLDSPHVVRVYDLFEENGTSYYVMDFLKGASLAARMRTQGHPFSEQETIEYTCQVLDALETVHAENIWHLDLKPGNIMTDGEGRAVLIDFGASKQFHDSEGRSLSTSTGLCYTPGYAPTEQIESNTNRMGPWTDLYALGATMYNMLTMKTPPSVSDIQDGEGFDFPEEVTPECQRMIRWMMNPNRRRRPQSVQEVKQFLKSNFGIGADASEPEAGSEPVEGSEATVAHPHVTPAQGVVYEDYEEPQRSKLPWILGGIAAAVVIILLAGATVVWKLTQKSDDRTADVLMPPASDLVAENNSGDVADGQTEATMIPVNQPQPREDVRDPYDMDDDAPEPVAKTQDEVAQSDAAIGAIDYDQGSDEAERVTNPVKPVNEVPPAVEETKIFDVVEQMPSFPGGDAALVSFLSQNLKYPIVALENGIRGRVVCTFVVDRDGSITDVKVVRSVDPSLDKEAVRVIKSMPKWRPGMQEGKAVRVKYTLPIAFQP